MLRRPVDNSAVSRCGTATTRVSDLPRAAVNSENVPWTAVLGRAEERVLERLVAVDGVRETRLVRLGAGGTMPFTEHGGADDVLVLEGALLNHPHGDGTRHEAYPAGTYIGLPAAAPRSTWTAPKGALVVAKARPSSRREMVVVATPTARWYPAPDASGGSAGASTFWIMPLDERAEARVVLLRFEPTTRLARHHHLGGEEFFVLHGALEDDYGFYDRGWWVRQPAGSAHAVWSDRGCTLFTTAGHLL